MRHSLCYGQSYSETEERPMFQELEFFNCLSLGQNKSQCTVLEEENQGEVEEEKKKTHKEKEEEGKEEGEESKKDKRTTSKFA